MTYSLITSLFFRPGPSEPRTSQNLLMPTSVAWRTMS